MAIQSSATYSLRTNQASQINLSINSFLTRPLSNKACHKTILMIPDPTYILSLDKVLHQLDETLRVANHLPAGADGFVGFIQSHGPWVAATPAEGPLHTRPG